MAHVRTETKASLNRRQQWFRESQLTQARSREGNPDDDPCEHGLDDSESRYADEDEPQPLDLIFR